MLSAAPSPPRVRLLHADEDFAFGHSERVFFVHWHRQTTRAMITRLGAAILAFTRERPRGLAILTIVAPEAKPPEAGARAALSQLLKTEGGKVVASAVAFEGDGFMAAVVRSVAVGLSGLTRQPFPHRVFCSVHEIAAWFASRGKEAGTPLLTGEIVHDVAEFRRQVAEALAGQGPTRRQRSIVPLALVV